jgi:hypothetical protein
MFKSSTKKKLELQKIVKENIEYSRFFSFEMKFSWGQGFVLERILKFSIFHLQETSEWAAIALHGRFFALARTFFMS